MNYTVQFNILYTANIIYIYIQYNIYSSVGYGPNADKYSKIYNTLLSDNPV